ncbi:ABC transporter substrate-binding protein, partial [Acinetobacter baumannii]
KDPNQWVNLYNYLQSNKTRNGRYKQAVQYVTRIRAYLEHIKTAQTRINI